MVDQIRPVMRQVIVPAGRNYGTMEWEPERRYEEPTGWVEVVGDNGLRAAARTEGAARSMLETMRASRAASGEGVEQ